MTNNHVECENCGNNIEMVEGTPCPVCGYISEQEEEQEEESEPGCAMCGKELTQKDYNDFHPDLCNRCRDSTPELYEDYEDMPKSECETEMDEHILSEALEATGYWKRQK